MKKFILKNPLNKDIEIQYKGKSYTIPANGEFEVLEDLARFWKRLHSFLSIRETEEQEVFLPEIPKEVIESVEEDIVPEKRVIKKKLK